MPLGHLREPIFGPPLVKAVYATLPVCSRGRYFPEPESATRTCYQRDRDRILHSTAFRRLKHKTQVFVRHEGDYYRTRLTHSLEVAQIARSMARVLALDEDLAETLALAHDLGHTPFGHAGEETLKAVTKAFGGFDHNAHALRLVTKLEHRYAGFDGLNLTWETLEGLVKHNGPIVSDSGYLPAPIASFDARWSLDLRSWPSLEAQIASLSDDVAYINHDIDDGLRARLFSLADLRNAPLAGHWAEEVESRFGQLEISRFVGEMVRRLMGALLTDLTQETRERLSQAAPRSAEDVRAAARSLAGFSAGMAENVGALKGFLFERMYRHPRIMETVEKAQKVIHELFDAFHRDPGLMPADWAENCGLPGDDTTAGVARDYIAGMTDRYALEEYNRVFHSEIRL
jgi:dGTPase